MNEDGHRQYVEIIDLEYIKVCQTKPKYIKVFRFCSIIQIWNSKSTSKWYTNPLCCLSSHRECAIEDGHRLYMEIMDLVMYKHLYAMNAQLFSSEHPPSPFLSSGLPQPVIPYSVLSSSIVLDAACWEIEHSPLRTSMQFCLIECKNLLPLLKSI